MTLPVLFTDEYGYHYGSVWYRGRFTATGAETSVKLNAITGKRGNYLVWLNGRYLGSAARRGGGRRGQRQHRSRAAATFAVPAGLLTARLAGGAVGAGAEHGSQRRLGRPGRPAPAAARPGRRRRCPAPAAAIPWRIQGARGGQDLVDRARGPLNTGGLYGERAGWTLPGYPDRSWSRVAAVQGTAVPAGVTWLRTSFRLDLPAGQDASVAAPVRRARCPPGTGSRSSSTAGASASTAPGSGRRPTSCCRPGCCANAGRTRSRSRWWRTRRARSGR